MSNVINLLEKLGATAPYATATTASALQQLDETLVALLLSGDIKAAEHYLGARSGLICGLHPAEEPKETPPAEQPDQNDEEEKSSLARRVLAKSA